MATGAGANNVYFSTTMSEEDQTPEPATVVDWLGTISFQLYQILMQLRGVEVNVDDDGEVTQRGAGPWPSYTDDE